MPEEKTDVLIWVDQIQAWVKHYYNGQRFINLESRPTPEFFIVEKWQPLPEKPVDKPVN